MNSCQKGKRGELEAARELERIGLGKSRRRQQYSGTEGTDDVACAGLPSVHIESKRTEALSLYAALEQAVRDCGAKIPVVMHRRNRKPWVFVVRGDDVVRFATAILAASSCSQE